MKRLLCIVGGMNAGGAETFLMKVYRKIDRTKYQFDFAVAIEKDGFYDGEINALGGKIYHITPKSKNMIKNLHDITKLVREEHYAYVLRISQHSLSALELFAAWLGGAKIRAFRSSNSNTTSGSKKELLLHKFFRFMPRWFSNVKIAPSTEAAEYMFGNGCIKKGTATIIHNGIDLSIYRYDANERINIRKEFEIPDTALLLGHIGRFNQQKNHGFLLDVFAAYTKANPDSVLMLVGGGELESQIKKKAADLGISDKIVFTGVRSDVPALLSAMDVFVFPSLYEGMPNTVIEAQATGLPCVIADTITREADITGLVYYLPLSDADEWAGYISSLPQKTRTTPAHAFKENSYDIETAADRFVKLVFEK